MSMWLEFGYDSAQTDFEEPAMNFQGLALIHPGSEILAKYGFEVAAFVQEYQQQQAETERRWLEKYNIWQVEDIGKLEDPSVCGECIWTGPSRPFPPEEAREWARLWIRLLRELPEEVRRLICKDTWLDSFITDLQGVIQQANCADQHGVKLRISIG